MVCLLQQKQVKDSHQVCSSGLTALYIRSVSYQQPAVLSSRKTCYMLESRNSAANMLLPSESLLAEDWQHAVRKVPGAAILYTYS